MEETRTPNGDGRENQQPTPVRHPRPRRDTEVSITPAARELVELCKYAGMTVADGLHNGLVRFGIVTADELRAMDADALKNISRVLSDNSDEEIVAQLKTIAGIVRACAACMDTGVEADQQMIRGHSLRMLRALQAQAAIGMEETAARAEKRRADANK